MPEAPRSTPPAPDSTIPISARAWAIAVSACVLASIDTNILRFSHRNWSIGWEAYAQSVALWLVFALLAQAPGALFDHLLLPKISPGPERLHPSRVALRSLGWTALPVIAHAYLEDFTGLGGDVTRLMSWLPWLKLAVVLGVLLLLVRLAGVFVVRVSAARTLLPVALAAAALGGALDVSHDERASFGAGDKRPNVLFLVWDTVRAQNTTPYGYRRDTTPNLARACEQAIRFETARSASVYTLSSHVSMLTGVHPSQHGARLMHRRFNPLAVPNAVRSLREAGYRTGAFVGTDVLRAPSGISHAFEHYADRVDPWVTYTHAWSLVHDLQALAAKLVPALRFNGLPHWFQDYQRPAQSVLSEALAWIDNGDPRPWFCFVNVYDAHWPYLPHAGALECFDEPYEGIVDGYSERGDRVRAVQGFKMNAADQARLVTLYDAELRDLDAQVDAFVGRLDLANTGLLLTSDHGEAFGEGGRLEHADILECQVRVPLVVRPAGGVAGEVESALASGVDVAPTLLGLAGLEPDPAMVGRNLLEQVEPDRQVLIEHRDLTRFERTAIALYDGPLKLVRHGVAPNCRFTLHDLRSDAEGLVDIAEQQPDVVRRLREALERYRARWGPDERLPVGSGGGSDVRALQTLGYLGDASATLPAR